MKTFRHSLILLALLGVLATASAQSVQLVVWDPQLQTKLGYGEVVGNKLNLQLINDYSGPVVALFSREPGPDRTTYAGLMSRYSGQLKSGVLTLEDGGSMVSLSKFLSAFKLTPNIQNAARTFSLPGLKTTPVQPKEPVTPKEK